MVNQTPLASFFIQGQIWIELGKEDSQTSLGSDPAAKHERCVSTHGSFVSGISLDASLERARTFISHHHRTLPQGPMTDDPLFISVSR